MVIIKVLVVQKVDIRAKILDGGLLSFLLSIASHGFMRICAFAFVPVANGMYPAQWLSVESLTPLPGIASFLLRVQQLTLSKGRATTTHHGLRVSYMPKR